jgi:hypothetical protein
MVEGCDLIQFALPLFLLEVTFLEIEDAGHFRYEIDWLHYCGVNIIISSGWDDESLDLYESKPFQFEVVLAQIDWTAEMGVCNELYAVIGARWAECQYYQFQGWVTSEIGRVFTRGWEYADKFEAEVQQQHNESKLVSGP